MKFSDNKKKEILRYSKKLSISKASKKYSVSKSSIYHWKNQEIRIANRKVKISEEHNKMELSDFSLEELRLFYKTIIDIKKLISKELSNEI